MESSDGQDCPEDDQASKRRKTGDEADKGSSSDSAESSESSRPPAPQAGRCRVPFCLKALQEEVDSLRADPPSYVSEVGVLHKPVAVCHEDGYVVRPTGEGLWDLLVCVSGTDGDDAYGFPFRVRIRFDKSKWPAKLAVVRFQCVFHHALTSEAGEMLVPFYRNLPRDERGACTVRLMLQAVHRFLVDPVSSWGLTSDQVAGKAQAAINAHKHLNRERFDVIKKYAALKLHPEFFVTPPKWKEEWLDPGFARARRENTPEAWRSILQEHLTGEVFSFKLFTEAFCEQFVEEIFNFYKSGLPARRPNSMNNYGIILNEIGLEPMINELQQMLQPIGELLFAGPGSAWDGHHCFIVRYRSGEDLGLDMHTDDSDVTFNVCLGVDFTGATLEFCGHMGAPNHRKHTYTYRHVKGSCVCHLGRKRHGAEDIESGERLNLILWNHSLAYRESDDYVNPKYMKEEAAPDAVCVSYTHDRDFGNYKSYPEGKEHFRGRGWCPRRSYEYEGFKADCEVEIMGS
mmetsp:Transcript_141469/g.257107  ORF Transcript_141469/g.257107 Transcript_141469/m.257107 type:complete len:515 (+) Transcript_141469:50-1594(+)